MKINFFAPINNLGYGIHSYNLIREFEARGHKITLIPPFGVVASRPEVERWMDARRNIDLKNPSIMIFCEEYLSQFSGSPRIGFPVFECEKFTPIQIAVMRQLDYIFTPTQWGESILIRNGIQEDKIRVVNEGYDDHVFPLVEKSRAEEAGQPFTFLNVGKFEARKGTVQAVECFFRALEGKDAAIILHIDNPFIQDYSVLLNTIKSLGFSGNKSGDLWRKAGLILQFSPPLKEDSQMADLYARADCGLYPTRAEGWGLPILESLATGIPCITGRWTAMREYVPEDYPQELLLKQSMAQIAYDGIFFHGDRGEWNVPTDGELIAAIRWAYESARSLRATSVWKAHVEKFRGFTWRRSAEQLEKAIEYCLRG